tara:strand:- start:10835 stop:10990 length:156 start_codon:yes stop_codon:yes gene_type:complete
MVFLRQHSELFGQDLVSQWYCLAPAYFSMFLDIIIRISCGRLTKFDRNRKP